MPHGGGCPRSRKRGWVGVLEVGNWAGEQGICHAELKDGFQEGSSRDTLPASLPSPLELPSPKGGRELTRESLSGLNQVAAFGGDGLRIPRSEVSSVPGLRICSLLDHGTQPTALLGRK